MLFTMVPGVSADNTVKYLRYYADMSGPLASTWLSNAFKTNASDNFSGFRTNLGKVADVTASSGQALVSGTNMGKAANDQVMALGVAPGATGNYISSTGFLNPDNNNGDGTFVGYLSGEKAHLSAQVYIPTGLGYYHSNTPGPYTSLSLCDGSSISHVKPSTSTITGNGQVVTFKQTSASGGEIWFLGAQKTTATWSANTTYTVDTVVTFGAQPTLSVYVNGLPLSMPTGITADGTATTTENVKLNGASYGIMSHNMMAISTVSNPTGATVVYTDEWVFENLKANEQPSLYNPVSIEGISDGAKVDIDELKTITVNAEGLTPDKVTLYINEEKIADLTSAPFTFNVPSTVKPGSAIIRAEATMGSHTFTQKHAVTFTRLYYRQSMNQDFTGHTTQTNTSNAGWYYPSAREWDIATGAGWFMTPATVTDKGGKHFDASFKFGTDAGADPYYLEGRPAEGREPGQFTTINFGYQRFNNDNSGNTYLEGNVVVFDWQMYIDNANMSAFNMTAGQKLFDWDTTEQKLKWNVSGSTYTPVKLGYWQNYVLTIDMRDISTKLTLTIDGETAFENATAANAITGFNIVRWNLTPDPVNGSFIALDNVKATHIKPRPTYKSIEFHKGAETFTDTAAVPADIDTIVITTEGTGLNSENFEKNISLLENGEEFSYRVDGELTKSAALLKDEYTIKIVPVRPLRSDAVYTVHLASAALFDDSKEPVGYDLDYSFATAYKGLDIKDITWYKNGVQIEDPSTVTFVANDTLKAEITMCNGAILDENVVLLLMGYNGNRLTLPGIKPATVSAGATGQVLETATITITDPTGFSATAAVWDSFTNMGIPASGAHIGR